MKSYKYKGISVGDRFIRSYSKHEGTVVCINRFTRRQILFEYDDPELELLRTSVVMLQEHFKRLTNRNGANE